MVSSDTTPSIRRLIDPLPAEQQLALAKHRLRSVAAPSSSPPTEPWPIPLLRSSVRAAPMPWLAGAAGLGMLLARRRPSLLGSLLMPVATRLLMRAAQRAVQRRF